MQTLDYSSELNPSVTPSKKLPPLEAVVITPSRYLRGVTAIAYLAFFGVVVSLVWSRVYQNGWWLMLPLLIGLLLAYSWRQFQSASITSRIWYGQRGWFLESAGMTEPVLLSNDALVWPWIIILEFKTYRMASRPRRLVIMQDSLSRKDFCQLSRWLRVCLKPRR